MPSTRAKASNCKGAATTLAKKGSSAAAKSAAGRKLARCRWDGRSRPKPVKKGRAVPTAEVKTARALKKKNDEVGKRARQVLSTPRKKKQTPQERYAAQAKMTLTPAKPTRDKTPAKRRRFGGRYGK